jgi:hypothetical protein
MLQKLTKEIAECHEHARMCRERAERALDPATKNDFLDQERRWLSLANSYEFAEGLSRFTMPFSKPTSRNYEPLRRRSSVDRDQELEHLAQADRHIAELKARINRQRAIVKRAALDPGRSSEMAETTRHLFEDSLRIFEKHRELVLDQSKRRSS